MITEQQQQQFPKRKPIHIPGCSEECSKKAKDAEAAIREEAARIEEMWQMHIAALKELSEIPPAKFSKDDFNRYRDERDFIVQILIEERAFREERLEPYLKELSRAEHAAREKITKAWHKEQERVRKGLAELGYDVNDPRQQGAVLLHPRVKELRIAVHAGASGTALSESRRQNEQAMEMIDDQLFRLKNQMLAIT